MSLNVSYHKEQQYIWFRSEDLNGFRDGAGHTPRGPMLGVNERNNNIYGLGVGI